MTYRKLFERRLGGKKKVDGLSREWLRHIDRIDKLPKPKKNVPARKLLELVSA